MQQITSDHSALLVLKRGEELREQLDDHARKQGLRAAWLQGVGGAGRMTLGYYDLATRDYRWRDYDQPLEILSLQGNLSIVDGQPFWHIHGTFSGPDFAAVGGHVKQLVIALTGELHITPLTTPLTRVFDDETGLKLIQPQ